MVNLALAIGSEAGELSEILAWTGDSISIDKLGGVTDRLAQELADVTILVVRFAALNRFELGTEIQSYIKESAHSFKVLVRL